MRAAIAGLIFLALAVPARADTWLPADPTQADTFADITAPDGTAVTTSADGIFAPRYVSTKAPGGDWRPPITVGRSIANFDVAVAPGGWVAIAWTDYDLKGTRLTVIRPDGTRTDRRLDDENTPGAVAVGIDARGNATVAWDGVDGTRTSSGFVAPVSFNVDVAVSPAGRRLLSWRTEEGVFARVDDAPAELVAPGASVTEIESEIGDDGAALIAYHDSRSRGIAVVDRSAGGAWTPPNGVSAGRTIGGPETTEQPRKVYTALTPEGRAVVAWASPHAWSGRVYGVAGRVGGAWGPTTPLSFPLRDASLAGATVDSTGSPRVFRTDESGTWGARPVEGDAPAPLPLGAELTFPAKRPATRDGALTVVAKARCAIECEVGLRAGRGTSRTLRAGETATLRLKLVDLRLLYPRSKRRLTIELGAADRFGQATVEKRTFRVRVDRRPLGAFRVGPSHDFAMGTRAGNRAVGRFVNRLIDGLAKREIRSERELIRRYKASARAVDRIGPVFDTAVGDEIYEVVLVPFALAGYDAEAVLGA